MKYTKTATFLLPLTCLTKEVFSIEELKNGKNYKKLLFINAYLHKEEINNYNSNIIYLILKKESETVNLQLLNKLKINKNFLYHSTENKYLFAAFTIDQKFREDYLLLINGDYSKISDEAKKIILRNNFFSGKPYTLPLILYKSESLKKGWEDRLKVKLFDQEVWSIMNHENETFKENEFITTLQKSNANITTTCISN
ncbi:hypothetical protein OAF16_01100 [Flavobacteriales bacterium]|nr:hypothetical protein [Flavobacteriales bacterium]